MNPSPQYRRAVGTLAGLVVIWAIFGALTDTFLTGRNIQNILLQSANVGAVAIGLTVVMIAAEIDLSVGALEAMAGAVTAILLKFLEFPVALAVSMGLGTVVILGALNGLVTWKVRLPSFVATLAMLGVAQGGAFVLTNGRPVNRLPDAFRFIGTGTIGPLNAAVVSTGALFILTHIILTRTRIGRHLFAVGGNAAAAESSGINAGRIKLYALMYSGFTSGVGGLILSARLNAGDGRFGESDLLVAVAAVIIGGTSLFGGVGTMIGTATGVIMVVSIKNGLVLSNVQDFWQRIVIGLLIILAMVVDQVARGERSFLKRRRPGGASI
ncbi:MAG: ABC transporter permease [Chloroflexi bacterium]|nr:ABC transporter permease [Chloroflexota bacterium]